MSSGCTPDRDRLAGMGGRRQLQQGPRCPLAESDAIIWLDYGFWLDREPARGAHDAARGRRGNSLWGTNRETVRKVLFSRDSILLWFLRTYRRKPTPVSVPALRPGGHREGHRAAAQPARDQAVRARPHLGLMTPHRPESDVPEMPEHLALDGRPFRSQERVVDRSLQPDKSHGTASAPAMSGRSTAPPFRRFLIAPPAPASRRDGRRAGSTRERDHCDPADVGNPG